MLYASWHLDNAFVRGVVVRALLGANLEGVFVDRLGTKMTKIRIRRGKRRSGLAQVVRWQEWAEVR